MNSRDHRHPSFSVAARAGERAASWRLEQHWPAVHERLVEPEGRDEIIGGEYIIVPPSDPAHATQHFRLSYVLAASTAPGYLGAVDMLTRTDENSDFAADVSIFSDQPDPTTGGRRLEELVFEVRNTERRSSATDKARRLIARGVRRVFYVHVTERLVSEWSAKEHGWRPFGLDDVIEDRCLMRGLPIRAILDAAAAEEAVAAALLSRGTRVLTEALAKGEAKGRTEGEAKGRVEGEAKGRVEGEAKGRVEGEAKGRVEAVREAILRVLSRRGFTIPRSLKARIAHESDLARLERWLDAAATATSIDDVSCDGAHK